MTVACSEWAVATINLYLYTNFNFKVIHIQNKSISHGALLGKCTMNSSNHGCVYFINTYRRQTYVCDLTCQHDWSTTTPNACTTFPNGILATLNDHPTLKISSSGYYIFKNWKYRWCWKCIYPRFRRSELRCSIYGKIWLVGTKTNVVWLWEKRKPSQARVLLWQMRVDAFITFSQAMHQE